DRKTEGALALADGVLAVDDVHAWHIEVDSIERFLKHRHLDDGLTVQDLATGCRLGFEQRRGAGDLDGFGDITDLEADVEAGLLGGAKRDPILDIRLEALSFNAKLVGAGIQVGYVPG